MVCGDLPPLASPRASDDVGAFTLWREDGDGRGGVAALPVLLLAVLTSLIPRVVLPPSSLEGSLWGCSDSSMMICSSPAWSAFLVLRRWILPEVVFGMDRSLIATC